jgi:hypothetical protein
MVIAIAILFLLAGGALAVVIPTLGSTTDVVVSVVLAVAVLGFVIWVWSRGGWWGGWGDSGRMGN